MAAVYLRTLAATLMLFGGSVVVQAGDSTPLKTEAFQAACLADPSITGIEDAGPGTPAALCECLLSAYEENGLGQADLDLLTKERKKALGPADFDSNPSLKDLLSGNRGIEKECKESLGLAE